MFLCYSILMICINATIGYGLMRGFRDCLAELVLRESAIIRMAVSDSDIVSATPCFLGFLGQNCFLTICGLLHMQVQEATVMLNEYCSTFISDSSDQALHLSNESQNLGLELIYWYTFPWLGDSLSVNVVYRTLFPPSPFSVLTKQTSGTDRDATGA